MASTITVPDLNSIAFQPQEQARALVAVATAAKADLTPAAKGANLTDAAATIQMSGGNWRVLPASTLTTARTLTLGTTGAGAGDQIVITRLDATANTYAVVNGGGGAGTLVTFPVSKIGYGKFQYDGTNWGLKEVGSL